MTPLAYLSSPYTKYHPNIFAANLAACKLAARLLSAGIHVYSPIAHSHALAVCGDLDPLDVSIWYPLNETMMRRCSHLLVAHMRGWQNSDGMAHEIAFFKRAKKPIFDLDPRTLKMVKR